MIKIALCDDELKWRENTSVLLDTYFSEHQKLPAKVSVFSSGNELLDAVDQYGAFDLYILDIVMPGDSGIDVGLELRSQGDDGLIVYLTTSKEFAVDSYLTSAFHYLLKPVTRKTMFEVMDRVVATLGKRRGKSISVKTKYDTRILVFDDIRYVELEGKSLCFHLASGETVISTSKRISFAEAVVPLLADSRFVQCGASFAVNLFYVKAVEKDGIVLRGGDYLALPKKACVSLRAEWLDYWFEGGEEV